MLGVKFFANMTTSSVERSMDCYVGKNKQVCLNIGAQKCGLMHQQKVYSKDEGYRDCMEALYREVYGEHSLEFCKFNYGNSSGIYLESEKQNFDIMALDANDHSYSMFKCYQNHGNLDAFCDDVYQLGYAGWASYADLLTCYREMQGQENSNIMQADVTMRTLAHRCESLASASEKYECLGLSTGAIDFCYDKYLMDFQSSDKPEHIQEIDDCVHERQRTKKFDPVLSDLAHQSFD